MKIMKLAKSWTMNCKVKKKMLKQEKIFSQNFLYYYYYSLLTESDEEQVKNVPKFFFFFLCVYQISKYFTRSIFSFPALDFFFEFGRLVFSLKLFSNQT